MKEQPPARSGLGWVVAIGVALVVAQLTATAITAWQVERQITAVVAELSPLRKDDLSDAKARQEVVALRVQNELRGLLWNNLLVTSGPMITAFVALVGSLMGLRSYLDARAKERRERQAAADKEAADRQATAAREQAARERERLDRAAAALKDALEWLAAEQPLKRAAGIVALQHFMSAEMAEFHRRVLAAFVMAAQQARQAQLEQRAGGPSADARIADAVRTSAEEALRLLPQALAQANLRRTLLAGVRAPKGLVLAGADLRDADLSDAELAGVDLSRARLTNAELKGATLTGAVLREADCAFADFAGADLSGADLRGANLHHARVQDADLGGADLRGALLDPERFPWPLTRRWRSAQLDAGLRERLIERLGPERSGQRVLMVMWEIAPLVAGGAWTAGWHLVRQLRRHGADVTVVVPWDSASIDPAPFGCEVRVVPLGLEPPGLAPAAGGLGGVYSSYGRADGAAPIAGGAYGRIEQRLYGAAYGTLQGAGAVYGGSYGRAPYGAAYGSAAAQAGAALRSDAPVLLAPSMLWLIDAFRRLLERFVDDERFDLVHAHDWVTFDAAAAAAGRLRVPWIAHFHSTEHQRRPDDVDAIVERIERQAVAGAAALIVPGAASAARLRDDYAAAPERLHVVPNAWCDEPAPLSQIGSPASRRVVYVGRFARQKGIDRFAELATRMRAGGAAGIAFDAWGDGADVPKLGAAGVRQRGALPWQRRGEAYADASVVVVPSRAEPFGMVVLEAMQHRVPVLYPAASGAAEVVDGTLAVDVADLDAVAALVRSLLDDPLAWQAVVQAQSEALARYAASAPERRVIECWQRLAATPA